MLARCLLLSWALHAITAHALAVGVSAKPAALYRQKRIPPCLTQAGVSATPATPVVSHANGINPCPCLSESVRESEVANVMQNAGLVGVGKVAQTANTTAHEWVARILAVARTVKEGLVSIRWGQVSATRKAIEVERQHEASVAYRMKEAVMAANAQVDPVAATQAAEAWARTQAMNDIVNLTNATMTELSQEEELGEELRKNATSSTQSLIESAKAMATTATAAETLALEMTQTDPEGFVTAVEAQDKAALAQVELSRTLSAKATKASEEAYVLGNSALMRAKAAKVGAAKALATAKRNTNRIAVLKARVQKAQQRAQAAASGVGVGTAF